jgi:predicted 3-demethylubiquinone-9 3-methyltransferase (glyoxalase superfamily)
MPTARPFLMFTGDAQAAMDLYLSVFPDSRVVSVTRHGEGGPGKAGTIMVATFIICGREFMCSDSPAKHAFSFTPSSSIFVECDSMEMLERAFDVLSRDGGVLMPPGNDGFSRHFCWINDRFGVSWQLNLAA